MMQQNAGAEKGWQEVQSRRGRRVRGKGAKTQACFDDLPTALEPQASAVVPGTSTAGKDIEACRAAGSADLAQRAPLFQDSDWFVVVERTFITLAPRHKLTHSSSAPGDLEGCLGHAESSPAGVHPWVPLAPDWSSVSTGRQGLGDVAQLPRASDGTAAGGETTKLARASDRSLAEELACEEAPSEVQQQAESASDDEGDEMPPLIFPGVAQASREVEVPSKHCSREEASKPQMVTIATQTEDASADDKQEAGDCLPSIHEEAGSLVHADVSADGKHATDDCPPSIHEEAGSLVHADVSADGKHAADGSPKTEDEADDPATMENIEADAAGAADIEPTVDQSSSAAVNKVLRRARRRARLREAAQKAKETADSKEATEAAAAAKKRAHERIVELLRGARTKLLERVFRPWQTHAHEVAKKKGKRGCGDGQNVLELTGPQKKDAELPTATASVPKMEIINEDRQGVALPKAKDKLETKCRPGESKPFKEIRIDSGARGMWSGFLFHPSLPSMREGVQKPPSTEKVEAEASEAENKCKPQFDVKSGLTGSGQHIFSRVDHGISTTSSGTSSASPVLEAIQSNSVSAAADNGHAEVESPLEKALHAEVQDHASDELGIEVPLSTRGGRLENRSSASNTDTKIVESSSDKGPGEALVRQSMPKKAIKFSPCSLPFVPHMKAQAGVNKSIVTKEMKPSFLPGAFSTFGAAHLANALAPKADRKESSVDEQQGVVAEPAGDKKLEHVEQSMSSVAAHEEGSITTPQPDISVDMEEDCVIDGKQATVSELTQQANGTSVDAEQRTVSVTQLDPMAQRAKSLLFTELQKMWAEEDRVAGRICEDRVVRNVDEDLVEEGSASSGSAGPSPGDNTVRHRRKRKAKVIPSDVVGQCVQGQDASRESRDASSTTGSISHHAGRPSKAEAVGIGSPARKAATESFSDTVAARVAARGIALLKAEMRKVQSAGPSSESASTSKDATAGRVAAAAAAAVTPAPAAHRPGAASHLFNAAAARIRAGAVEVPADCDGPLRTARAAARNAARIAQQERNA